VSVKRLLLRYVLLIGLREGMRCSAIRPQVRVGAAAFAGAVFAPFAVFVLPVARLYWLITGRQLPRPFSFLTPQPYVFTTGVRVNNPPEIRELLEQPDYNWEPDRGDIARWWDIWARVGQALYWHPPIGLKPRAHTRPH
jgi:hypothetical protein